jgi:hypothetical protein
VMVLLKAAAFHEAGHAITALGLGCRVQVAEIAPWAHVQWSHHRSRADKAVVSLAGNLAEQRGCPHSHWDSDDDLRIALDAVEFLQRDDPLALLQTFLDQADALVDRHWHYVELIAAALLENKRLSGEEIDALVRF